MTAPQPPSAARKYAGLLEWFAGLTCDHLYEDCPSRTRAEATLRQWGWWDLGNDGAMGVDPFGTDICGLCFRRYARRAA